MFWLEHAIYEVYIVIVTSGSGVSFVRIVLRLFYISFKSVLRSMFSVNNCSVHVVPCWN